MKGLGDWLARDVITVAMVTEGDATLEDLGIMEIEPGQTIIKCKNVEALPYGMVDPQRFAAAMKLAGGLAGHARNLGDEKRALKAENAKLRELVRDYHTFLALAELAQPIGCTIGAKGRPELSVSTLDKRYRELVPRAGSWYRELRIEEAQ